MITCSVVEVSNAEWNPRQSTYTFNDTVTYACKSGFDHVEGQLSITCIGIQTWSDREPTCQSKHNINLNYYPNR